MLLNKALYSYFKLCTHETSLDSCKPTARLITQNLTATLHISSVSNLSFLLVHISECDVATWHLIMTVDLLKSGTLLTGTFVTNC